MSQERIQELEEILENIRAVIKGRITDDLQDYQIGDRAITKIPIEELIKLENHYGQQYQALLDAQDIADGLKKNPNKIRTRFL